MVEEVKGQPIEKPIVNTMKACIVGMQYKIKNNDEEKTPKLDLLAESHSDAEKVKKLLEETLGWQSDDIETFKDSSTGIKNVYNKINNRIQNLKILA